MDVCIVCVKLYTAQYMYIKHAHTHGKLRAAMVGGDSREKFMVVIQLKFGEHKRSDLAATSSTLQLYFTGRYLLQALLLKAHKSLQVACVLSRHVYHL